VLDEDTDLAIHLSALGRGALMELRGILEASAIYRGEFRRALIARRDHAELSTLIAMADTDETVRLRLLEAMRDLGSA